MSPTSYQAAPPRVSSCRITGTPRESSRTGERNAPSPQWRIIRGHGAVALGEKCRSLDSLHSLGRSASHHPASPQLRRCALSSHSRCSSLRSRRPRRSPPTAPAANAPSCRASPSTRSIRAAGEPCVSPPARTSRPRSTPRVRATCSSSRPARRTPATSACATRASRTNAPAGGWIVVRTDVPDASLGAPGKRMTPSRAASLQLARIVSPNYDAAIGTDAGAHHWRLTGVEIAATPFTHAHEHARALRRARERAAQPRHDAAPSRRRPELGARIADARRSVAASR